jgi:subfamily B ATP-binding cassette protein HlyB/CyaB
MTIGLFVVTIFEVALTFLRTFLMGQTSSKIDVELGSNLFGHLLHLPISYFETRRVGDSVARVRELENIRNFLTGNTLTVILDILFSMIFLGIMFWYSAILTIIVLVSIPMYALVSFLFTPILQKRLEHKFNVGAENQSFLVETVSAVQTVKSMAIEPRWQQRWDGQLAAYVVASLSTQNVANLAGNAINLINKFVTIAIIFFGSIRVTNGDMKVGELIAFNMLASQISTPILRLSQLWNDFQQVGISMSRMSDILDARTEVAGKKINLPALSGIILFDNVSFRYKPDSSDILKEVNLLIQPGEVIGIVGRSGSGKSTLTKLIQRLYLPTDGRVLVDGQDLALIDTVGLRRQIGVVLQENMLFNRSIRDNISVADPAVELEKIIEVAKLAGAHEFICELPNGYDTMVGEHGTGLSGGQRQRITIARTLIRDPRILILDEATSALDYESEKIIQDNMHRICQGRTVIIIAHRLSAVRTANRIVVMDRGKISQIGSHKELMLDAGGIYHQLHSLQHS